TSLSAVGTGTSTVAAEPVVSSTPSASSTRAKTKPQFVLVPQVPGGRSSQSSRREGTSPEATRTTRRPSQGAGSVPPGGWLTRRVPSFAKSSTMSSSGGLVVSVGPSSSEQAARAQAT